MRSPAWTKAGSPDKEDRHSMTETTRSYTTVKIEREGGIGWVILNRPEKRNAMNPTMHYEMLDVLDDLEFDPEVRVVVITGAGDSWTAGQDLKEYFRETENNPRARRLSQRAAQEWRWNRLWTFPKPTIAMVNGYCFGGGFVPLIACDFAIAAEDATFGLSEVNWGTIPAGLVSRVLAEVMNQRQVMLYAMTARPFDGRTAAQIGLVTWAVPRARLREETVALARELMTKSANALAATKQAYKYCQTMDFQQAASYLNAMGTAASLSDPEKSRERGLSEFLDSKSYRPGFRGVKLDDDGGRPDEAPAASAPEG
jgi:trans-feruloyl-CoA hydratase/vanillin synthase